MNRTIVALLSLTALTACQTPLESSANPIGSAVIRNGAGAEIGTARLFEQGAAVTINVVMRNATGSAVHAVHLHETGTCTSPGFTSAGSHLNPAGNKHGLDNSEGPHLGDLPNIALSNTGTGTVSATLGGAHDQTLRHIFDADGTAIVIHAAPDDNRSDPSGGSGERIACGVFQRD